MTGKLFFVLAALLALAGCDKHYFRVAKVDRSYEGDFAVRYIEVDPDDYEAARERAVDSLQRRGYRIDEVDERRVETYWRAIRLHPGDPWYDTWYRWKLTVRLKETVTVKAECMERKAQSPAKGAWNWMPCSDKDVLNIVKGSAERVAEDIVNPPSPEAYER